MWILPLGFTVADGVLHLGGVALPTPEWKVVWDAMLMTMAGGTMGLPVAVLTWIAIGVAMR